MMSVFRPAVPLLLVALLAACDVAELPVEETQGPNPTIPPPSEALIPAINIAPAGSWQQPRPPRRGWR